MAEAPTTQVVLIVEDEALVPMAAVGMVEKPGLATGRQEHTSFRSGANSDTIASRARVFAPPPSPRQGGTIEPFQGFELLSISRLVTEGGGRGYCPYR